MHCPITYEEITQSSNRYSGKGLALLSKNLSTLNDFDFNRDQQHEQIQVLGTTLSIEGAQPKLQVTLNTAESRFEPIEKGSTFYLKPQNLLWDYLPENEDLTMRLAATAGIETPLHGLIYCTDDSFGYWIRRFDRPSLKSPNRLKLAVEDFAQLCGLPRDKKYDGSLEEVAKIIEQYTTFPLLEKEKLFKRTIFNYLVGNENSHLKSFALVTDNKVVKLAPAYDLMNTTLALGDKVMQELALSLNGKKVDITPDDLLNYLGMDLLKISQNRLEKMLKEIIFATRKWPTIIESSFIPPYMKEDYLNLTKARLKHLLS